MYGAAIKNKISVLKFCADNGVLGEENGVWIGVTKE